LEPKAYTQLYLKNAMLKMKIKTL